MANVVKRFYTGQPSTSIGTLYTVPSATKAIIKDIVATNCSTAEMRLRLHFVPASSGAVGTAAVGNALLYDSTFAGTETKSLSVSLILDSSNDTIQALASTTANITLFISGLEVT